MNYPFGTTFNLIWQYKENFPPIDEPESVYIFDSQPSLAVAKLGTGAFQTISTWEVSEDNAHAKTIEIEPIDNPSPNDAVNEVSYWVAINYLLQDTEQEQTDVFEILLRANKGNLVGKEANISSIKEIFPEICSYATDLQIANYIAIAKAQAESDFKKKGIDYSTIRNLPDFWLATAYKVISLIGLAEFKEQGDRHFTRYEEFSKLYDNHMRDLRVEVDTNVDGVVDTIVRPTVSYLINNR